MSICGNLAMSCSSPLSLRSKMNLLETSAPLIRMRQPRDMRALFRWFFSHHISGPPMPQTSITFQQPEHCPWSGGDGFVNTKLYFQPSESTSGHGSMASTVSTNRHHHPLRSWCCWQPNSDIVIVDLENLRCWASIPSCIWSAAQELKCIHCS